MVIRNNRRLKAVTGAEQAALFHGRERRRGLVNPERELFGTHRFVAADSGFDVGDAFPTRTSPLTIAVTVRRTSSLMNGIVFEMGDATTGVAIFVNGDTVSAVVGDAGDDGVTLTADNALLANDQIGRIVFAVIPGSGQARLWVNGELRAGSQAVNGTLPNGYAADSAGGIGEVSGTVTARVPSAQRVTLTGAEIISPVTAYANQRPRHFSDPVTTIEAAFSPTDVAGLSLWYDPSDPDSRTIDLVSDPDLITDLVNKADPGDGDLEDALTGASAPRYGVEAINGRDALEFGATANRALRLPDASNANKDVGTGDFDTFIVVQAFASYSDTSKGAFFANCASDTAGGGYSAQVNHTNVGDARYAGADIDDGGRVVFGTDDISTDLTDGNPHVIHCKRRNGAGVAGADRFELLIDGVSIDFDDISTSPYDLGNDGSTNAAFGWFLVGCTPSAPTSGQRFLKQFHVGEILLYNGGMSGSEEAAVVTYLSERWGVA